MEEFDAQVGLSRPVHIEVFAAYSTQVSMRTVVIGNSGSGKTWLSRRISFERVAPLIHLDDIFWQSGGFDLRRESPEVIRLVQSHLQKPHWVVEGVFGALAAQFMEVADELVWLDIPWRVCRARLLARGSESKQHMAREQSRAGLQQLLSWAEAYISRDGDCSHQGHQRLFSTFAGQKYLLCTQEEVANYLSQLR